ncbi:MAG: hypothetical protein HGB15_05165 [Chlorobaculum sp.]|nr:hypothetical protein [Chlorobaculum sp.]
MQCNHQSPRVKYQKARKKLLISPSSPIQATPRPIFASDFDDNGNFVKDKNGWSASEIITEKLAVERIDNPDAPGPATEVRTCVSARMLHGFIMKKAMVIRTEFHDLLCQTDGTAWYISDKILHLNVYFFDFFYLRLVWTENHNQRFFESIEFMFTRPFLKGEPTTFANAFFPVKPLFSNRKRIWRFSRIHVYTGESFVPSLHGV